LSACEKASCGSPCAVDDSGGLPPMPDSSTDSGSHADSARQDAPGTGGS
jgi:hypothetical protein